MQRPPAPSPSRGEHASALRDATAVLHRKVEQRIDVRRSFASVSAYSSLLGRLLGFHAPLEPLLADRADAFPDLLPGPPRSQWLAADLRALGGPAGAPQACLAMPSIASPARTLGVLYVIEGSALGGAVLATLAERRLALTPSSGCAFFSSDGQAAEAVRWPAVLAHVERYGAAGALPEVIAGAIDAFDRLDDWLANTEPATAPRRA